MSDALFAGIDAGSSATKCAVVNTSGELVGHDVVSSGFSYADAAEQAIFNTFNNAGLKRSNLKSCIATGYGRESISFASRFVTEITCHARGAREWYPQVRNIIDIGGQDTKVIRIDAHGQMADYRMNAKCAAGTGTFLESIALRLGMPLSAIDNLAMQSEQSATINSYCTVFAGTEVLERIKAGDAAEDICMGLFISISKRILEMISAHDGPVAATGGVVTYCKAMVKALESILDTKLLLPPLPQQAGAFGAALLALEFAKKKRGGIAALDTQEVKPC